MDSFVPTVPHRVTKGPPVRGGLLFLALVALAVGLVCSQLDDAGIGPKFVWTLGTLPVVLALSISIVRDSSNGRIGVDAIALVSMGVALSLGETLAAIVVAIMYAGGTVLEEFARRRAGQSLAALVDRTPHSAHRKAARLETIAVDEVAAGDELMVLAGEIVPVDGELADSEALLDESAVSGEPLPERRRKGDALRSGTINAGEAFAMRASTTAARSTYAAIVGMVAAAQAAKAPFIRQADRYAMVMLPATLLFAGLAWYWSGDPVRALAVLVAATPSPLVVAAPVAFIGGISHAARRSVIMTGSAALEAMANVRTAAFDKTGTLTLGGLDLIDLDVAPGRDADHVLRLVASLEQASQHILAESIQRIARNRRLVLLQPTDIREYRGSGIQGVVGGVSVAAGSRALILKGETLPAWAQPADARYLGQPVLHVFVTIEGRLAAVLTFGDTIRAEARNVLDDLRSAGVSRFVMLTGDDALSAGRVADTLGIDAVVADAGPADKIARVELEKRDAPTMMVGDGINDAPALAAATVGVALGARGPTISAAAADIVIMANRLQPLADCMRIARRTRTIALESMLIGMVLSASAMLAGAFGLLTPVAGALVQEAIDVAVILNALRTLGDATNRRISTNLKTLAQLPR